MKTVRLKEILDFLDKKSIEYRFKGDKELSIKGFSSLTQYKENSITWIKMLQGELPENICLAVVQDGINADTKNQIITSESKYVFFSILEEFYGKTPEPNTIGQGTYISPDVKIGKNVVIGHNCTIDGDIHIGDNTRIYNNVNIINYARIGANCEIQSGVNIGHDGFGFTENENHEKTMVKHYGGTIIGDNVYIGGNTYIERGTIDNTVIGNGTKIDGSCTVGHNCIIGKNVAMVGGTIVFGSVNIEDNAYIASGIIKNKTTVGQNSLVGIGSVVTKNVEADAVVVGVPAKKIR